MKAVFVATVLLAVAGAALAQTAAELAPQSVSSTGVKYWKDPIIAAKANNLTDFAGLVNDAGLSAVLNDSSLVSTIFAPTNEAIAKLQESTDPNVQDILSNTTKLQALLMYHVVPGATLSANRIKNMTSTSKTGAQPYKTMEGEKINATVVGDSILVDGVAVTNLTDVQGGKTMIQAIDGVLIPEELMLAAPAENATAAENVTGAPIETTGAPASTPKSSGAAGVAASLLLAVPALMAALL